MIVEAKVILIAAGVIALTMVAAAVWLGDRVNRKTRTMRKEAKLCFASAHSLADQLSAKAPSARRAIDRILKAQEDATIDILRNWRRDSHDC
ncbi:MAG: hypothetical protein IKG01_10130 [Lachnospiraceae bacterium]|nr:hypothetical protein [Lachnospiraceae bacterium]